MYMHRSVSVNEHQRHVQADRLQHDRHDREHHLHEAELQRGALAEAQEPDRIRLARQAARELPPAAPASSTFTVLYI